ncbi:hypothetical protein [Thauera sp.]|uniref:hypothetical protein n=1 Tax=Thauera sp. TaxID=1905334 RepID=UPI0039E701CA
MFPLLPFVAGVLTGAVALRLAKADKTKAGVEAGVEKARAGMEKAQGTLRGAAVSSLEAIENASARARKRLSAEEAPAADAVEDAAPADAGAPEQAEKPAPARRKRAPRAAAKPKKAKAAPAASAEAGPGTAGEGAES